MGKLTVNAPFDGEVLGELETTNETGKKCAAEKHKECKRILFAATPLPSSNAIKIPYDSQSGIP